MIAYIIISFLMMVTPGPGVLSLAGVAGAEAVGASVGVLAGGTAAAAAGGAAAATGAATPGLFGSTMSPFGQQQVLGKRGKH